MQDSSTQDRTRKKSHYVGNSQLSIQKFITIKYKCSTDEVSYFLNF